MNEKEKMEEDRRLEKRQHQQNVFEIVRRESNGQLHLKKNMETKNGFSLNISETRENLKSLFELCGLPDLRVSDLVIQKAKEIGEKEMSIIRELSNEEKLVIEQTTQLLEFYSD